MGLALIAEEAAEHIRRGVDYCRSRTGLPRYQRASAAIIGFARASTRPT
jgi:hypothetical protein